MKRVLGLTTVCAVFSLAQLAYGAGSTGSPFYGDPPDEHHPWAVHDQNRPQPPVVTPGTPSTQEQPGKPPSDAVVLFDGTDATLANWEADKAGSEPTKWIVKNGAMECVPGSGYVRTKEKFGDCQLHVEWAAPSKVQGDSQGRGNSGIFIMGVEIQVLDNYNNPTYADGFAASVYGVNPPMANALRPPGEFQNIDIVFRRPIYKDGKPVDPGYVTVLVNGVLVQDHTQLEGGTGHMGRSRPSNLGDKGALRFQDHGNPVRFRNVWYRPLPPRAIEGGTDGFLTTEATMAKRKEIAATLRADAAKLKADGNPVPKMLRLAESLCYEKDDATMQTVEKMAAAYIDGVKQLAADKIDSKKDEVKRVNSAFGYLIRHKIIVATYAPKAEMDKLIKERAWDKK
jgi:hypothetical protein